LRRKRTKPSKKGSASKRGPFFAPHPLNAVPFEIRQRMVKDHGERERAKFEDLTPKLVELLSRLDPLSTVALMSTYGLMSSPDARPRSDGKRWASRIQQGHVEFLQALCLRNRFERGKEFPEPESIQKLFDWLPELFGAYHQMRIASQPSNKSEDDIPPERGIVMVQEFLRGHTSVVRNWGYFGTVTRICKELFSRIDADYQRACGTTLSGVVEIFERLVRRHEDKINEHRARLHGAFQGRTKEALLDAFFAAFPLKGDVHEFRERMSQPDVTLKQVRWALLPWSDRFIVKALLVTNEEISREFGVDLEATRILTNRLSLALGDLVDEAPESFFLDNPVWLRPLVYLEKDVYFCALPQTLMSFIFPIVDVLVASVKGLPEKLSDARALYLEEQVSSLVAKALPGSESCTGFKWREGAQEFESDLVVRFDTTLILIEAKSGRVSWPALRGARGRIVEHIKKLIVEPSDQSGRLAERIREDLARLDAGIPPVLALPLSLSGVTCVVRLSVMLHDFATIQSVPGMLIKAGALTSKYPLAPCMSLADLEVMLDLLEAPFLRLHYLRRRAELLLSLDTIGDELDTLGMYLDTGMNLGSAQEGKKMFITAGYSAKIDHYYTRVDEGLVARKPKPSTSAWFIALCEQLSSRARTGWSEIACALLSIAPTDQQTIEKRIRALATRVRAGKPLKEGHDAIVLVPPEWIRQAIAVQVKQRDGREPYGSQSLNIARQAFQSEHVDRCVVIVVDAGANDLPYLSAGIFLASDRQTESTQFF